MMMICVQYTDYCLILSFEFSSKNFLNPWCSLFDDGNSGEICLFVQFARGVPNCSGESKQTDEQLLPEDPSCEAKAQTSLTLFRLLTSCGVAGSLPYRELVPDCGCRDPRQAGQRDFSPAWLHDLKRPLAKLCPIG